MAEWFSLLPPAAQALLATLFTWGLTAAGAATVFFFRYAKQQTLCNMLGCSAGIMTAASFWSLLAPAIEMAEKLRMRVWFTVALGFLGGCVLIWLGDRLHARDGRRQTGGMMVAALTLHNIPEGMAVGVAFGSLVYQLDGATLTAACLLALGIGIQNFPEGMAVSVPLLREGYSKRRAFWVGQLSGMVEPFAGVLGAILVLQMRQLLPYLLAFAGGAMLYVVMRELIPESQKEGRRDQTILFTMLGFAIMMILDISL